MSEPSDGKSLLERVTEGLPAELRDAYNRAPKRGPPAHEVLRLYSALHLWREGLREISFEKVVECSNGEPIYVDIFVKDGAENVYIECERYPVKSKVKKCASIIKAKDNFAKVIVAIQDRVGWYASWMSGAADEVWIVCRNGDVVYPGSWASMRRRLLYTSIHEAALLYALASYREAEETYARAKSSAVEEEVFWRPLLSRAMAAVLGGENDWILKVPVRGVWLQRAEQAERDMLRWRTEALNKVFQVINTTLALASPYQIAVDEKGTATITVDQEAAEWLGWKDYPCSQSNSHFKLIEKTLNRELRIVQEILKFERTGRVDEEYRMEVNLAELSMLSKKMKTIDDEINALREQIKQLEQDG
ncbi:MAG: hypothetical protein QW294_06815 [Candidatus Bathyarchaeia archaeon]